MHNVVLFVQRNTGSARRKFQWERARRIGNWHSSSSHPLIPLGRPGYDSSQKGREIWGKIV
jgi:hypothetical protein